MSQKLKEDDKLKNKVETHYFENLFKGEFKFS